MRIPEEGGVKSDIKVANLGNWINMMLFCEMRERTCESVYRYKVQQEVIVTWNNQRKRNPHKWASTFVKLPKFNKNPVLNCAKEMSTSGTFNGNVSCFNVLERSIQIGRKKGGENSNLLTTYNYGPGSGSFSVISSYWKREKMLNIFEPGNEWCGSNYTLERSVQFGGNTQID